MNVLDQYNAALDQRAAREKALAVQAQEKGDERQRALHLMQASMCGDMLKALGRTQHQNSAAGPLAKIRNGALQEGETLRARDDFDGADRARIKAETIAWAMEILEKLEKENAESSDAV